MLNKLLLKYNSRIQASAIYVKYFLWGLFGLLILTSLYHFYFSNKIIPGVKIGNVNVGGQTYATAKKNLSDYIKTHTNDLILKINNSEYTISNSDIGLEYNLDAAITRAFEVGRTGNFWVDNRDKLAGLVKTLYLRSFYDFEDDVLANKILVLKGEVNNPEVEAKYELSGKDLGIAPSKPGRTIDDKDLYSKIISSYDNIDFTTKTIPMVDNTPQITEVQLEKLKPEARKIVYNQLRITYGQKSWLLNPLQMLDLLLIDMSSGEPELQLNRTKFEAYADNISQEINISPKGEVIGESNGKVTGFKIVETGRELNIKQFAYNFEKTYLGAQPTIAIDLEANDKRKDPGQYGIVALLGTGHSKFAGSIPGRIHNLTLAAARTSGILIPPSGIYSFNKTVGEISGATGYDSAYIIKNGRTVFGEGGGVCQTSTTLFRAVLNSGLPVLMRYPHAYRVHYYEEESPVGIDASVFQPTLDFQFKNDTPNYILVQTSWDLDKQTLDFKIYGTPDGRTVEITEPVVTNVTAAPAPLYQDDPTLAKGVVRQIDFAAGGANVSFNRTVKRNGEILYKDIFSSRYQPWRAIFLVGTKI